MAVMVAATAVATMVADFTAEAAAASMAAVLPFTAADFVQVMSSTAAFVDIGSHTGITFTGISIMRRPTTITRTATAGWSGPITDRVGSAAIARGITTIGATTIGIIAIGEIRDDG
jgi:hypothetical protein